MRCIELSRCFEFSLARCPSNVRCIHCKPMSFFSSLDAPTATLLAATATSVLTVVALINGRSAELRSSQRKLLETEVGKLATALYEVVATADILLRTKSAESHKSWSERATKAKDALILCQRQMRYPLWGITDALRTLSRLPGWTQYAKRYPTKSQALLQHGDNLRDAIDRAVLNCLRTGRTPSWFRRWRVGRAEKRLIHAYKTFRSAGTA